MGVLKVFADGEVRKVGCGGGAAVLQLQLVADDLDAGYADADLVMSWADAINGTTFAPGDSTVAPTFKTSIINGHDVVRWPSGKQLYRATTPTEVATESFTHVMVISTSTSGGTRYVYGMGGGNAIGTFIGPSLTPGATDDDGADVAGVTALSSGVPSVVTLVRDADAGTLALYVDGVLSDSVALAGWTAPGGGFSIGDNQENYPNNSFIGDLGELRMYDGALAPADRYAVEDELATTYGITLAGSAPGGSGGRLKLYADGRIWREVCDDDTDTPEVLYALTEWSWTTPPTQVNSQTIAWRIDTFGSLPANNLSIEYMKTGGVAPGDLISTGAAPATGGAGPPAFYTYPKTITLGVGETLGEFRAYRIEGGVTTLVVSWTAPVPLERRPIEIDLPGGVTAAVCMTPA